MAAKSMPPVPEDTPVLTVEIDAPSEQFELSYLEATASGMTTDLTSGCEIKGGASEGDDDDGDSDDEDDDEDDEDEDDSNS